MWPAAHDPRVPKEEAQQVLGILKKNGRVVDLRFYQSEVHGFAKREYQIDSLRRTMAWFDQYLIGKSTAAPDRPAQRERRNAILVSFGRINTFGTFVIGVKMPGKAISYKVSAKTSRALET